MNEDRFYCEHCKKDFSSENTLLIHACEKKNRFLNKDELHVRIGFGAYRRFYEMQYPGKKPPDYKAFMNSKFYIAFVKFGKYVINTHVINRDQFIDFLIKNIKIDDWTKPSVYELFVRETLKKESPDNALERNILLMESWSTETGEAWYDFFRKIDPSLAVLWIKTGRISPWIIYSAKSANDMFDRMNDEQLGLVQELLDPALWKAKMKLAKSDVVFLKKTLAEFNL